MVEMAGRERSGEDLQKFRDRIEAVGGGNTAYALLLGLEPADNAALVARVEEGFLYRALERLRSNVGLSREALADLVQIKPRTLDRRKGGRLRPEESDRLLRAARVFGGTIALFEGDADAARTWLSSPQRALGGAVPLEMARTEVGAREVESLVGRLEHGVFS
jgi:putative toxin-antitoxin system antitoxin component (TIGR02293 family)